jgi:hypothetical protein
VHAARGGTGLFGFFQGAKFAAEEGLSEHGKLVVGDFALFVELHASLDRFAAAALALLRNVTFIVCHSNLSLVIRLAEFSLVISPNIVEKART